MMEIKIFRVIIPLVAILFAYFGIGDLAITFISVLAKDNKL